MRNIFVFFAFVLLLFSCDSQRVFEENKDFDSYAWSYDNTIRFETAINDSLPKNVLINFRHSHFFGTRNMLMVLQLTNPKGEKSSFDINIPLSEPNGMWYGDCVGDICDIQYQIPSLKNYTFKEKGVYIFELAQNMRENPLKNSLSVGLRIENINK